MLLMETLSKNDRLLSWVYYYDNRNPKSVLPFLSLLVHEMENFEERIILL